MGFSNLFQKAGDNSTQTSVQTMNVYNGITPERAIEICQEQFALLAPELIQEAREIAQERVNQFSSKLLPKLASYDEQFRALAEPSYLVALRKAQLSSICTDKEADYELLSELMLERAQVQADRRKQVGIAKALEIVGQVSDEALLGLSVIYIATRLIPITNDLHQALQIYNQEYAKLIGNRSLPESSDWIDELDVLTAVRIGHLGVKSSQVYFSETFSAHLVGGVEDGSEDCERIKKDMQEVGLPVEVMLVPHPLKPNYLKLATNAEVDDILLKYEIDGKYDTEELTSEQRDVLQSVAKELRKDESKQKDMQKAFILEWNKYPTLKMIGEWWDKLAYAPMLTPVGLALGNAYVRTIDPSIPKLY